MKTINDYPMQLVFETPRHIMWIFSGKWQLIDNFAATPVEVDVGWGRTDFRTSEHAFAAAKAQFGQDYHAIKNASNPGTAKALGRKCKLRPDWEDIKFDVMWRVLIAKFQQNPKALEVLMSTRDALIYEGNTWNDDIWGVVQDRGPGWRGRNALGQMLTEIRDNPGVLL